MHQNARFFFKYTKKIPGTRSHPPRAHLPDAGGPPLLLGWLRPWSERIQAAFENYDVNGLVYDNVTSAIFNPHYRVTPICDKRYDREASDQQWRYCCASLQTSNAGDCGPVGPNALPKSIFCGNRWMDFISLFQVSSVCSVNLVHIIDVKKHGFENKKTKKKHVFYPIIKNMEKTLKICFHVDSVTPKSSTCAGVVMYRVVPKY